jgi:hypothetical protein
MNTSSQILLGAERGAIRRMVEGVRLLTQDFAWRTGPFTTLRVVPLPMLGRIGE